MSMLSLKCIAVAPKVTKNGDVLINLFPQFSIRSIIILILLDEITQLA